jgi:hypothetical protein
MLTRNDAHRIDLFYARVILGERDLAPPPSCEGDLPALLQALAAERVCFDSPLEAALASVHALAKLDASVADAPDNSRRVTE